MENEYQKYFYQILKKYNEGTASKEEADFLEAYYNTFELKDDLINDDNEADFQRIKISIKETADKRIDQYNKTKVVKINTRWIKYAAAAIILISSSVVLYLVINQQRKKAQQAELATVIVPGGNKAVLTLSNGTKIVLDNAHTGQIARQSNINITKTAGNQIVYTSNAGDNKGAENQPNDIKNTITTPNGGQYQLVLPDGTKVMLNAASSLTYPTTFHGTERLVQLNGEAYFEVAKNRNMPFRVVSGQQTVEVLGTHFDVNAYNDETSIRTTLIEGLVKVSSGQKSTIIIPGQQAIVSNSAIGQISKKAVDVNQETAWKDGLFSFQNDDIETIMRQVARWYDVKIVYKGSLTDEKFSGEITRSSNLTNVLKILELNNVHFEIEGKTITVSAKK